MAGVILFQDLSSKFESKVRHPSNRAYLVLSKDSRYLEASDLKGDFQPENLPGLEEYLGRTAVGKLSPEELQSVLMEVASIVVLTITGTRSVDPEKWHPLARTLLEASFMDDMMKLVGSSDPDVRPVALTKLAAMSVPTLSVSRRDLAIVRRSDEAFFELRQHLQQALEQIELISSADETWPKSAREIVAAELPLVVAKVERSTKKSPALSAARTGTRNFGVAGLGAVAGAVAGGNLPSAAVGAGMSKGAEAVGDYISALRRRRSDRALLQLALSFTETTEP
jgi:hypothetical protein